MGTFKAAPTNVIFSGFGHPALATIIAVFLVSKGIVHSGLLQGLGHMVAKRIRSVRGQVICIAAVSSVLSAFMNNVGAVGLLLPTTMRMAHRSGSRPELFGIPLAMASILGGTMTLIGSAPNIIIATYMVTHSGQPFKMFDFAPHGIAMIVSAFLVWALLQVYHIKFGSVIHKLPPTAKEEHFASEDFHTHETTFRSRRITFFVMLLAIFVVSVGWLHPALGFGWAALVLFFTGILKLPEAYKSIDLGIIFFLGSMISIGQVLEYVGALDLLSTYIAGITGGLSPFWLILLIILVASIISNIINNSAAAVFMAPLAAGIASSNNLAIAAALMAVAAGANLTLLLPTHQATLIVMSEAPFPATSFLRIGFILTICCAIAAALVITLVWQ